MVGTAGFRRLVNAHRSLVCLGGVALPAPRSPFRAFVVWSRRPCIGSRHMDTPFVLAWVFRHACGCGRLPSASPPPVLYGFDPRPVLPDSRLLCHGSDFLFVGHGVVKVQEHVFDVVVGGARGEGLRAALGMAGSSLKTACVLLHGANRLGTNFLLDLIVFGRATAQKARELISPKTPLLPLQKRVD